MEPETAETKGHNKKQLPQARSTRLTWELEARVAEYLRRNSLSYNMLIRMALEEFISVPRTLKLEPVPEESRQKITEYSLSNAARFGNTSVPS